MLKGFEVAVKIIEHDVQLIDFTINQMRDHYAIYEIWTGTTLLYIGCVKLKDFFTLSDATTNPFILKHVHNDQPLSVVIKFTGDRVSCFNKRSQILRALNPVPPANRYRSGRVGGVIVCNEDGKRYKTQQEAAQFYGISQGNLSGHLSGRNGFATCKGWTFTRVIDDTPME